VSGDGPSDGRGTRDTGHGVRGVPLLRVPIASPCSKNRENRLLMCVMRRLGEIYV
jgi:hypothetical protein